MFHAKQPLSTFTVSMSLLLWLSFLLLLCMLPGMRSETVTGNNSTHNKNETTTTTTTTIPTNADANCLDYVTPNSTQRYRLQWESRFSGMPNQSNNNNSTDNSDPSPTTELTDHWTVWHESDTCHGNWIGQESCNTRENIHVDPATDLLVLSARKQPYLEANFTGAMLTSRRTVGYGRTELRAALPRGQLLRTCLYTPGPRDLDWRVPGQIVVCVQQGLLKRSVYFANHGFRAHFARNESLDSVLNGEGEDEQDDELDDNAPGFHLIGFEWTEQWIRFFVDDRYTETYQFNDTHKLQPPYHLRLYIGVGLRYLGLVAADHSRAELDWRCPSLLVDRLRYYATVGDSELNGTDSAIAYDGQNVAQKVSGQTRCTLPDSNGNLAADRQRIQSVCSQSAREAFALWDAEEQNHQTSNSSDVGNNSTTTLVKKSDEEEEVPRDDHPQYRSVLIIPVSVLFVATLLGATIHLYRQVRRTRTQIRSQCAELCRLEANRAAKHFADYYTVPVYEPLPTEPSGGGGEEEKPNGVVQECPLSALR